MDFGSINEKSNVKLIPEPENPHDRNAIKVTIDNNHVGYISKDINQAILKEIELDKIKQIKIKKIIGGHNDYNKGILISITISNTNTKNTIQNTLGPYTQTNKEIIIIKSNNPKYIINEVVSWDKLLEFNGTIPPLIKLPNEPNYENLYKKSNSIFERLIKIKKNNFINQKRTEWMLECQKIHEKNEMRSKQLEKYKKYENTDLYFDYLTQYRIKNTFASMNIYIPTKQEIEATQKDGYITDYENIIFELLPDEIIKFRQARILSHPIDILVVSNKNWSIWALEIDGEIHNFENNIKKDEQINKNITKNGISIIRIPNYFIKNNVQKVIKKINETINQ